jgi:hypothetical protein
VDDSGATAGSTAGFDLDAIEAVTANAAAVVFLNKTVQDSPPGGNGDGKLDPGETAGLVVALRNIGRLPVMNLEGRLVTPDTMVLVLDSTGLFGTLEPESVRYCWQDKFRVSARPACPREHVAGLKLLLSGTGYYDSCEFTIVVGELRATDPIPDGPRRPELYWAYDDVDSSYEQRPRYEWVEIRGLGTRLSLSDDQTVVIDLPPEFGPVVFYGQRFTQVSVCGNGWVAPGSTTSSAYTNTGLPDGTAPMLIAMNWDDLYPPTGGGVWYYHDASHHRFIVEFDSVPYYNPRTVFEKNQLIICDTTMAAGTGNSVFTIQYKTANAMSSSTVGEQDPSRQVGIQVLYDGVYHRAAAPIVPGRAIRFTTDTYQALAESRPAQGCVGPLRVGPNPWTSGRARITVGLVGSEPRRVSVFDASGRMVCELLNPCAGQSWSGPGVLEWDGCDQSGREVGSGVYLVQLQGGHDDCCAKLVRTR